MTEAAHAGGPAGDPWDAKPPAARPSIAEQEVAAAVDAAVGERTVRLRFDGERTVPMRFDGERTVPLRFDGDATVVLPVPVSPAVVPIPAVPPEPSLPDRLAGRLGNRTTLLLMLAVAAIAAGIRLWRIDAVGFNSDEVVYAGQAAALARNPTYAGLFPVFRAHPMIVQIVLSPLFRHGEVDVAGRFVVVGFGVATVLVVYLLGARLYGRRVGVLAALLVALMPYHVVVTRQVLLDGPMVLFATLTLYLLVRYVEDQRVIWFMAAGAMLGVTMLAKESSIVLAAGVYAFLALTPSVRRPLRACLVAVPVLILIFATNYLAQQLAGKADTGKNYLVWQLLRRPNHTMAFYAETVPFAIGLGVLVAAAAGLWWLRSGRSWRETLLLCWIVATTAAFELWPVKGFQYLLPVVAPVAVLAARGLLAVSRPDRLELPRRWVAGRARRLGGGYPVPRRIAGRDTGLLLRVLAIAAVLVSLLVPSWTAINQRDNATFLAGSGGIPGGREAGRWLAANTPAGSRVLTLGPSMANILQYYGHRQCFGLSVSPNPLHRNPSYTPLPNPDSALRHNEMQYIAWDKFSAERSSFFSAHLLAFARRYHGRIVHTETVMGTDAHGRAARVPVIVIYEVRP